jgi:hypothetical protein
VLSNIASATQNVTLAVTQATDEFMALFGVSTAKA